MLGLPAAVIFDLDGVLADSRVAFLNCVHFAFDALGLPRRRDEELLPYLGPPFVVGFPELLNVEPNAPIIARLIDLYRERYRTASLTETTTYPGMPEAVAQLPQRLGVATSKPRQFAEPLIVALGLRDHFEVVAGPAVDHDAETKAQTLQRALRELETTDAIMVGDRRFDVEGAHANGIPCIGVTWGFGTREELETAGADRIIDEPSELPVLLAA
jgi:phosphoglycolate phosphatase